MMHKSFIALAVLAAFAGSAAAAEVQLYGRVNLGLNFTESDMDVPDAALTDGDAKTHSFTMNSGDYTGTRFGLRGNEELGNGWKVGFVLENGFDADTGALHTDGTIFDREAIAYFEGPYGKLAFGRTAIMASDAGSFGVGGALSPFGTGWADIGSQSLVWGAGISARYDNMVSYQSPTFAGFSVIAQYSFGKNTDAETGDIEGTEDTDRYYGLGVTYANGPANFVAVFDAVNKKNERWVGTFGDKHDQEDTYRVVMGGSWDFGMVKPFLSAAYFKDGSLSDVMGAYDHTINFGTSMGKQNISDTILGMNYDGYGVVLGATAPIGNRTFYGMVGYMDAEYQNGGYFVNGAGNNASFDRYDTSIDVKRWMVGVGYDYALSSRTKIYAGAGYFRDKMDSTFFGSTDGNPPGTDNGQYYTHKYDPSGYQVLTGIAHYF